MSSDVGVTRLDCCGLKEIIRLGGYRSTQFDSTVWSIFKTRYNGTTFDDRGLRFAQGALVFTANARGRGNYGKTFADDIVEHGLGLVTKAPQFKNPNTGHYINAYIWVLNMSAIRAYLKGLEKKWQRTSTGHKKLTDSDF